MLLALDIGNTNVTIGLFEGETLRATWRLATDPRRMKDEYAVLLHHLMRLGGVDPRRVEDAVLCSVVPPLTGTFEDLCREYLGITPLVVSVGVRTGIRVLYDSPRDVGADRIVDAAAAYHLYGGPVIIVDFGTATVFDAVSREGEYLGGAIAPGLQLSAEALFLGTSQLRRVELVRPRSAIGRNTVAAIQSGVVLGHAAMVEGMVRRFRAELGEDARAIATGGLAPLIAQETSLFHAVDLDLSLRGLRLIWQMNRGEARRRASVSTPP